MTTDPAFQRVAVVVHPARPVSNALATLVSFGPAGRGLDGLRRRRLIADSPRILARDDRGGGASTA